jgi:hypothetical protein
MAKLPTWRNINAPNFTNSGIAAAIGAFTRGGQGFNEFADQMSDRVDLEDERLTNEHITAALAGNPLPSNRRVDQAALQSEIQADAKQQDDFLTSKLTRTGLRTTNDQALLDLEQDPALFNADIAESKAATARYQAEGDLAGYQLGLEKVRYAEQRRDDAAIQDIETGYLQRSQDAYQKDLARKPEYIKEIKRTNPDWSDAQVEDHFTRVIQPNLYASSRKDLANSRAYFEQVRIKYPHLTDAQLQETTLGRQIATVEGEEAAFNTARRNRASELQTFTDKLETEASVGASSLGVLYTPQGMTTATTESEVKANTLKLGKGDVSGYLNNTLGLSIDDDNREKALQILDAVGGNKSAFDSIMREYGDVTSKYGPAFLGLGGNTEIRWGDAIARGKSIRNDMIEYATDNLANSVRTNSTANGSDVLASMRAQNDDAQHQRDDPKLKTTVRGTTPQPTTRAEADVVAAELKSSIGSAKEKLAGLSDEAKKRNPDLYRRLQNSLKYATGAAKPIPRRSSGTSPDSLRELAFPLNPSDIPDELDIFDSLYAEIVASENVVANKKNRKDTNAYILSQLNQ